MIKKIMILMILVLSLFMFTACGGDEKVNDMGTNEGIDDIIDEKDQVQDTTTTTSKETDTTSNQKYDTSKAVTTPEGCYDSDGGSFDKVLGFILDTEGTRFEDECVNQFSVREYYCGPIGYKSDKIINCKFECKNGICVEGELDKACIDSDYYDEFTKGTVSYKGQVTTDYCSSDKLLVEQICSNVDIAVTKDYICESGCSDGKCNSVVEVDQTTDCTDVDIGPDAAFTKTNVVDKKGIWADECLNVYEVKEYYCNSYGFHTDKNIRCDNGCEDGACIQ